MKVIIGYQAVPTVDATSVRIKTTTADPVSTCSISVRDDTSSLNVSAMQELWVIDEQKLANPTWNLLQGPSLKDTDTSRWSSASSAGFSGTVSFVGAPPVTISVTNDTHLNGFAERFQYTQPGMIIPGQQYMLSGYLTIATPLVNSHIYLYVTWFDASRGTSLGTFGCGNQTSTPGGGQTRISGSGTAPAGAVFAQVHFGIQIDNATTPNGGTGLLATLQFEPMWFANEISYPTPDCNPAQTNCVVLPNNTTIRQYRKFGGWVNHWIAQDYHGNARTLHIDAVGYAWLMSSTYTISAFTAQYDSAIISSLLTTYYTGNASFPGNTLFSTTNVVQGVQIANLQPNWDDLRTIFDGLAAQAGFFWTVDPYWNLIYEPPGYTQMPIALICDNSANPDMVTTFPAYSVAAETDFTQPGCSVLVIGGNVTLTLTAALTGGTPVTTLTVSAVPIAIPSGTVLTIGQNQGIILSGAASVNDTTLNINSFNPGVSYSIGTQITSNPYVGSVFDPAQSAIYNNALYGFGIPNNFLIRKLNDAALESVSDVTNRGIAELIQYDTTRLVYHVTTNAELLVGQGIQVTDAQSSLNATTLLIQQVVAQWIGKDETLTDTWEYKADLGSVNRAASSILSHIYRQTQLGTSAPAVNQTSLVVLEKFTYTDVPQYPYPLAVLADSPVAYYRFGEASGLTAYDSSGNGYLGTISNSGITYSQTGVVKNDPNMAFLFDGAAGEVTMPAGASVGAFATLTLEAWFNLSTASFATFPRLFSNDSTVSSNNGCELYLQQNAAGILFSIGNGTTHVLIQANYQFQAGVWYYVAGTWSNSDTNAFVYIQKVGDNVGSTLSSVATGTLTGTIGTPAQNMSVGYNAANGNYFPGTIDEPAVYQGRLSTTRLATHFKIAVTGHS